MEPLCWQSSGLELVDQRQLPHRVTRLRPATVAELVEAIAGLAVRGAPAIGLAGAYGVALAALEAGPPEMPGYAPRVRALAGRLARARPTAVNLGWAVGRVLAELAPLPGAAWPAAALAAARRLHEEDRSACRRIAAQGAELIRDGGRYLTHCNAGPLATSGVGTALGILIEAARQGKRIEVLACETRPLLQGARLTTFELLEAGIPCRLIADGAAAWAMARLGLDGVVIGADRIAMNGDTANKIGSYGLALAAHWHGVPVTVAAPCSTLDAGCPDGAGIPVEERSPDELTGHGGTRWAPHGVGGWNPAFDVVPAEWITNIVTDAGLCRAPFSGLREWAGQTTQDPGVPQG
jgi:methylthioribose-1-phosphate isomerase